MSAPLYTWHPIGICVIAITVIVAIASQNFPFMKQHPLTAFFTAFFVVLAGGIYVLFFLDWIRYPSYANGDVSSYRCYSPNREYYVERWQSPWSAVQDQLYVAGTAKLYDKTGMLLYSNKANLSTEFGPEWFDESLSHSSVFYQGSYDWIYQLPSPSGDTGSNNRGC